MKRFALVLSLALLTGCGVHPLAGTAKQAAMPQTLSEASGLDRETAIALNARALAEAIDAGETDVVKTFVAYADGADADPAATRQMAQQGLAQRTARTESLPQDVARIAAGGAHPRLMAMATGIHFPQDEGSHPFAIMEWWYLNGHLNGADGAPYGYEMTLFKVGPLLHWAHVAVTDAGGQHFNYNREWIPPAKAVGAGDHLALTYAQQALSHLADGRYQLAGDAGDRKLSLTLTSRKAPLLIGGNGKIDMPEGKDSWYYSLTRLDAEGTLDGQPVSGISWMDHQWGPFWVSGLADRWDWFALQMDDQTEYNLFGFRSAGGKAGARHVNESKPDGQGFVGSQFTMDRQSWWQSPRTRQFYTTSWKIDLPETHESVELKASNVDQELARKTSIWQDPLPTYWEGNMEAVKTTADGRQIAGKAYCEHFGFATPNGPQ